MGHTEKFVVLTVTTFELVGFGGCLANAVRVAHVGISFVRLLKNSSLSDFVGSILMDVESVFAFCSDNSLQSKCSFFDLLKQIFTISSGCV